MRSAGTIFSVVGLFTEMMMAYTSGRGHDGTNFGRYREGKFDSFTFLSPKKLRG
jgi:hypothetical protein